MRNKWCVEVIYERQNSEVNSWAKDTHADILELLINFKAVSCFFFCENEQL